MLLQRTYAGRKYPHIRTAKHNSTVRNQSTEAQWQYTFQHYSPSTLLSQCLIQYDWNITSLECTKVWITGDLQDIILVDAYELKRNLESWSKKMYQEDLLLSLQASTRFRSCDLLRFRCALWSATESPWYSRLRDLNMQIKGCQMQPSEYIKMPSGVHQSKYSCTENKWNYVKACLCMHGIMFKSYQWKYTEFINDTCIM